MIYSMQHYKFVLFYDIQYAVFFDVESEFGNHFGRRPLVLE